MAKNLAKVDLNIELQGWDLTEKTVANKNDNVKLSDGQGNHLTEGKYKLENVTKVEFADQKDSKRTFTTLVAQHEGQTIWISQFVKRAIDPKSGAMFMQATGPWAENLQKANGEGKAAKYILENPNFEIVSSTRKEVKDPYTNEVKSKWCYVTK